MHIPVNLSKFLAPSQNIMRECRYSPAEYEKYAVCLSLSASVCMYLCMYVGM
jgi:hypothetical protein